MSQDVPAARCGSPQVRPSALRASPPAGGAFAGKVCPALPDHRTSLKVIPEANASGNGNAATVACIGGLCLVMSFSSLVG